MRKKTMEKYSKEMRRVIAHELMVQADAIVEILIQDEIRNSNLDIDTTYDVELITDIIGTDCFNIYLPYKSGIYQLIHCHYEDSLYFITNQNEVRKYIRNSIRRINILYRRGDTPDERN